METTEREQLLINIIKELIQINSIFAWASNATLETQRWLGARMQEINVGQKQEDLLRVLDQEFGIKYTALKDVESDVIERKEDE